MFRVVESEALFRRVSRLYIFRAEHNFDSTTATSLYLRSWHRWVQRETWLSGQARRYYTLVSF